MRYELRKRGVDKLKVVYSEEIPLKPATPKTVADRIEYASKEEIKRTQKRQTPGSISFVPPVAGMIIAGEVIRDLLGITRK